MLTKILQTLIAKFITLKAAIRPQNTYHKATAAKGRTLPMADLDHWINGLS